MKAPKTFAGKRAAAFDVELDEDAREQLANRLADEIDRANQARSSHTDDNGLIDFAWSLYEQQSQRGISRDNPRYGSADLTSPIGMEHVDTLSARASKTIFTSLLWIVEGKGKSSKKAAVVELYMQWRQEEMRLQSVARRVFQSAFVEGGAVFEVCEDVEPIVKHGTVRAKIKQDDLGNRLLDADGDPVPETDQDGVPVPAMGDDEYVDVKTKSDDFRRRGASVRRRSMKDFRFLPSHAEDESEVWGHATRRYERLEDLQGGEARGVYVDVEKLGATHEREQRAEDDRGGITVQQNVTPATAEAEIWRIQFLADLDGKGKCMYIADVSAIHRVVLNLKYDWLNRWRTVYANPYPCAYSVYGYSQILTKLLTTIEEHTAWRNMNADRGTLKSNAPMKRLVGALWDPSVQPIGAGQLIDVNDMNELQPMEFEDVTQQALQKEQQCVSDGQRIIGVNDIAVGQQSAQNRTLGENKMATQGSFLRTDDPIGCLQESMEDLGALIHAIEVESLRERESGVAAPAGIAERLSYREGGFDGDITADMIDGDFAFKPRGSVEDADPVRRQQKFTAMMTTLANAGKINPIVQQRLATPEMADAIMQYAVDEFHPRDTAPFLKPMMPTSPSIPGMTASPSTEAAQAGGPPMPPGAAAPSPLRRGVPGKEARPMGMMPSLGAPPAPPKPPGGNAPSPMLSQALQALQAMKDGIGTGAPAQ
ncbi:MAG: hypothetical protein ABL982_03540 [Vicinamibacterales bacterium]